MSFKMFSEVSLLNRRSPNSNSLFQTEGAFDLQEIQNRSIVFQFLIDRTDGIILSTPPACR